MMLKEKENSGAAEGTRTPDPLITKKAPNAENPPIFCKPGSLGPPGDQRVSGSFANRIGMRIPVSDVELYLLLGWRLTDAPGCSAVLMMLPPPGRAT